MLLDLVLLDLESSDAPLDDVISKLFVAPARIIGFVDRFSSIARERAEGTGVELVMVRPIDYEELGVFVAGRRAGGGEVAPTSVTSGAIPTARG